MEMETHRSQVFFLLGERGCIHRR